MRSVTDAAPPGGRRIAVEPLMQSSRDSWCEASSTPPASPAEFGPGDGDVQGSIAIGCVACKDSAGEEARPGARLVVLGDTSFLSNRNLDRFAFASHTHLDLFRNSLNWLLEREALIRISPRRYEGFRRLTQLDITDRAIRLVMWGGMMGMPLAVLLLGLAVWFIRRR